jgi:hypothetical protein
VAFGLELSKAFVRSGILILMNYAPELTQEVINKGVFFAIMTIPFIWSLIWSYKDAKLRGKHPLLVALMIALTSWPASILVWLIFRPGKK